MVLVSASQSMFDVTIKESDNNIKTLVQKLESRTTGSKPTKIRQVNGVIVVFISWVKVLFYISVLIIMR